MGKLFYENIKNDFPDISVKFVENPSPKDILWADALASFVAPKDIDINKLKWIHSFGASVNQFLERSDFNKNTLLSRTFSSLGVKMGEYCLAHLLNFAQKNVELMQNQNNKIWRQIPTTSITQNKVLILGTGQMAQGILEVFSKLNINTIGMNTNGREIGNFAKCITINQLSTYSNTISCVINTLPSYISSYNMIDLNFLKLFQNVLFINVGRGQTVVDKDILIALDKQYVKSVVLDVFREEPLPQQSKLWLNPNVIITPHQSAVTAINDIVISFKEAYNSLKKGVKSLLFTTIDKGY